MEYTEYLIYKTLGLLAIVIIWQFLRGLNGLPPEVTNDNPLE